MKTFNRGNHLKPSERNCSNCRFWAFDTTNSHPTPGRADATHGECRKLAPKPAANPATNRGGYLCPVTPRTFWCGEYEQT